MTSLAIRHTVVAVLTVLALPSALDAQSLGALTTCSKPEAPLELSLTSSPLPGGDIELTFGARPLRSLTDLSWSLSLAGGVVQLGGADAGSLDDLGGGGRLVLAVPGDGRFAEAELELAATLAGLDERVAVTRRLTWGTPETGARPVTSLRATTGEPTTVTAVPAQRLRGPRRTLASTATQDVEPGAPSTFVVSGSFSYEDKDWGLNGWTGIDPLLPVRHADVVVIDAGAATVLASGSTAADGSFSLTCQASGLLDLVIRCDAAAVTDPAFQRSRVHALGGWTYVLFAEPVLDHDPAFDLDIGSYAALKLKVGSKEGNPFNVFDMNVAAFELLHAPPFAAAPIPERFVEHLWPSGPSTHAFVDATNIGDDDGYDDAVILHEIGHVVQSLWSAMQPYGGSHSFGDSDQNPRLSLSEGFATCFEGLALARRGVIPRYVDSNGGAQNGGAQLRMTHESAAPYTADARGIADELAVACALFDLLDDESFPDPSPGTDDDPMNAASSVMGLEPGDAFWRDFTAAVPSSNDYTLNDVWDRWFELFPIDNEQAALTAVFQGYEQHFVEDTHEPDGAPELATPLAPVEGADWTGPLTLYATDGVAAAPGIGDHDWFVHDLVVGSRLKFVTRYPGGANDADTQADTQLELFDPEGVAVASDLDSGVGRNARLNDVTITATGPWSVRVSAQDQQPFVRRYGRYEYRAQMLFENHLPALVGAPVASPNVLGDDESATLSAQAADPDDGQALSFVWTPLDGGTITGVGAAVQFVPAPVDVPTEVSVQVVAVDELGAESAPGVVTLLVTPGTGPCSDPASVLSVGGGKAGQLGVPMLSAMGLPALPSADLVLHVQGALPGLSGWIVAGFSALDAPFDQGTLHPHPALLLGVRADANGEVVLALPLPAAAELCGLTVATQALFSGDPGASGSLHTAQSNGLDLTFGH